MNTSICIRAALAMSIAITSIGCFGGGDEKPVADASTIDLTDAPPLPPTPAPKTEPMPAAAPVATPTPAPEPAAAPAQRTHKVAAGETLYAISVKYYGNGKGVEKIKAANPGLVETRLPIGKTVVIP